MSIDYYVYLKKTDEFSIEGFETYCTSLGLCVAIHPEFNLLKNSGFVPMRLMDERFAWKGESGDFLTGFELESSAYQHILPVQKKGFFQKLFQGSQPKEGPFDLSVKNANLLVYLRCGVADSFEILMAYLFGAYLVKTCDGVFDDPQVGQFYENSRWMETEVNAILTELQNEAATGELRTHPFIGWT